MRNRDYPVIDIKKSVLACLSLMLLFSSQPPASAGEKFTSYMIVDLVDSIGGKVASSAAGTRISVNIFLADKPGVIKTAKPITFSFAPTKSSFPSSSKIFTLDGDYNRTVKGILTPTSYVSIPFVITTPGMLKVDFAGDTDYTATSFTRYVDVWTPQKRTTTDQADQLKGFQVHAVYVVPSDATDAGRDTSGQISSWLMQGARWLDRETGDHWQYDKFNSTADVTYLRSSYPTSVLALAIGGDGTGKLLKEIGASLPVGSNRKTYLFFIETTALFETVNDTTGNVCGLAAIDHPRGVLIAADNNPTVSCSGYTDSMDSQAMVAVHEVLHTFGTPHIESPHDDIMSAYPGEGATLTLDTTKDKYFGSSGMGVDIEALPIWSRSPISKKSSPCSFEDANATYSCKIGITTQVPSLLLGCYEKTDKTLVLQIKDKGKWVLAPKSREFKSSKTNFTICDASMPISYSMTLSSKKAGIYQYRFVSKTDKAGIPFSVVYQN